MNPDNPLENLRDIHLPNAITDWPPALGWWILGSLLLLLLAWGMWKIGMRYQQRHLQRMALSSYLQIEQQYLNHQNSLRLIKQYSNLLRRVAMARFSRPQVASLTGKAWLNFLDQSAGMKVFRTDVGQLLLTAPFQKADTEFKQLSALTSAIKQWIETVTNRPTETLSIELTGSSGFEPQESRR